MTTPPRPAAGGARQLAGGRDPGEPRGRPHRGEHRLRERRGRDRADGGDVGARAGGAGREREHGVAVEHGVHGVDGARQAVVRHARDLGRPRALVELRRRWRRRRAWCCRRAPISGTVLAAATRCVRAKPPPASRGPASTAPLAGSTTSPAALTATSAPTVTPPARRRLAEPRPLLVARSKPSILPTVAPVPAPTQPCGTGAVDGRSQAASPAAASGRTSGRARRAGRRARPRGRCGTRSGPTSTPAAVRLQPAHHAGRGVEAEGAAAAEQHGVHALHGVHGVEQVGLARAGRRAAHVHAGHRALARRRARRCSRWPPRGRSSGRR